MENYKEETFRTVTVVYDSNKIKPYQLKDIRYYCEMYDPYSCMIDDFTQMKRADEVNKKVIQGLKDIGVYSAVCRDIDMPQGQRDLVLFLNNESETDEK